MITSPVIEKLLQHTRIPVIGAPMFLVSGTDLVVAQCTAGVIGSFPSLNARPQEELPLWIQDIQSRLSAYQQAHPDEIVSPFGVNLIVHPSNPRWEGDLEICASHKVPLFITSLHAPNKVVERVHPYGGIVLHDVTNAKHARKAIEAGVDGLILVASGAGGHAGTLNPIALVNEIRSFYDGPLILSGCISHGKDVLAALALGCDFAYLGTRFIPTEESMAPDAYQQMIINADSTDIIYSPFFTGVPGNYLKPSILAAGLDPAEVLAAKPGGAVTLNKDARPKAWKDIWGAGQGVGAIAKTMTTRALVDQLIAEFNAAKSRLRE
jgi:nitronate monooxygenase